MVRVGWRFSIGCASAFGETVSVGSGVPAGNVSPVRRSGRFRFLGTAGVPGLNDAISEVLLFLFLLATRFDEVTGRRTE